MLEKLKDDQRKARRGGWHDNIAAVLFGVEKPKTKKRSDVSSINSHMLVFVFL